MINRLLIEDRLSMILDFITELEKVCQTPQVRFLADRTISGAAESYLRRSLEAIFDIGRHILAKTGSVDLAAEYKSIASGLVTKGVIDPDLGETLIKMAGYRNRLVHLYHQVSDEELYSIIIAGLNDIKSFIRQIKDFLATVSD